MIIDHLRGISARTVPWARKFTWCIAISFTMLLADATSAQGLPPGVWAVDAQATGTPDGLSWDTAFPTLQDALDVVSSGEQIWVAVGVYLPGSTPQSTFLLQAGVAIYAGFSTGEEDDLSQRNPDPETNGCVLSGIMPGSVFAYHVVTATDIDEAIRKPGQSPFSRHG